MVKMGQFFLILIGLFLVTNSCSKKTENEIDKLVAFAKVYGYVRYFHPSKEANEINWNNFSIHGVNTILKESDSTDLAKTLSDLFTPIAPSFLITDKKNEFNITSIIPKNKENYQETYWQHKGLGIPINEKNPYESVRVNSIVKKNKSSVYGKITKKITISGYQNSTIKLSCKVKLSKGSEGTGHLRIKTIAKDGSVSSYNVMMKNPIKSNDWNTYAIEAKINSEDQYLVYGISLRGKGTVLYDKMDLKSKEGANWKKIVINDSSSSKWDTTGIGYKFIDNAEGIGVINFVGSYEKHKAEKLFNHKPKFGSLTTEKISNRLYCNIPLSLYINDENTFPVTNQENFKKLQKELKNVDLDASSLSFRLGNIVNIYNVFKHFYPYFDVVEVDWDNELEKAIKQSYKDKNEKEHLLTIKKLLSPLNDGHINVAGGREYEGYTIPIAIEWIENQLVVSNIYNKELPLKIGDVITHIDTIETNNYLKELLERISAGTKSRAIKGAIYSLIHGEINTNLVVRIKNKDITLKRKKGDYYHNGEAYNAYKPEYKPINNKIFYLNLEKIDMAAIVALMPDLVKTKAIICDLRGYPNANHDFISHLLKSNDTTSAWMKVPEIIYPDNKTTKKYGGYGWSLKAKAPYLGDKKIIFITDENAISYAESYMAYIRGYNLGTIIGQPTAGTNGNINNFTISGGYQITWTGMKVVKHDGSTLHGIGVKPDVYIKKTIKGFKEGKDEFLNVAIKIAKEN